MGRESFSTEAVSPAPPNVVFSIVANGAEWRTWAGPFIRWSVWEREGDPPPGGIGSVRRLGTRWFFSREEVVEYDPPHHLAYKILSGQPARDYRADVELTPHDGGTHIRWRATFAPKIPGTGAFMRWYLRLLVAGFARRLATYAGTQAPGRSS